MKETINIEKEVYECVLRNSVKVADLEAENMQLRQFCEEFNALDVAKENQKLKELLKNVTDECDIEKQKALLKINELSGLIRECNLLLIKQQANDEVEHKESAELVLRIEEVLK